MKIFVAFLFLISPFAISNIFACLCDELPSIYPSFEQASVVFSGKAISIKEIKTDGSEVKKNENINRAYLKDRIYTFKVLENFKDVNEKDFDVYAGDIESDCEIKFEIGKEYLIYGNNREGKIYQDFCSRTGQLKFVKDEIYFIRRLLESKPEPLVYGSVKRFDFISHLLDQEVVNLADIKINIEDQNGKSFHTQTNKQGIFSIDKLPPGQYKINLQLADDLVKPYSVEIFVDENNQVSFNNTTNFNKGLFLEFNRSWDNKISGTLTDTEGKIVNYARISLLPISQPNTVIKSDSYSKRLNMGKYVISRHSLDRYYLVAEVDYPTDKGNKYRQFYPQTRSADGAFLINLKENDKLTYDIRLPFSVRKLEGKIIREYDPQMYESVLVYLTNAETDNPEKNNIFEDYIGKSGNFSFDVFEGATYWLHAVAYISINKDGTFKLNKSKPIKVTIGKTDLQLNIIIPKPDKMDLAN